MRYIELKEQLKDFMVFSLGDIKKIDPFFHRQRLNEWQNKGYIRKIINQYYYFSDLEISEPVLFIMANKIYGPSYISFEMALSYYNLIPESVYAITSASSRKTQVFDTPVARFSYRKIKPSLMFGYNLIGYKNRKFKIADVEKTILDFFYINPRLKNRDDFEELRINKYEFTQRVNQEKLAGYSSLFGNKSLEKRINNFLKFVYHA